ncbi:MAG: hypothetical protein K2W95_25885 [Candidatus Obscuribacterales bacterium]|nr:hypothetical protein [Candidatus Obscuribacterales bacterium]
MSSCRELLTSVFLLISYAASTTGPVQSENALISGSQAATSVHCLTRAMRWHTNLEEAQAAARSSGRLVVWIHMLGTIDGAT